MKNACQWNNEKIHPLTEKQAGKLTIQVYDYADNWIIDGPCPEEWHEIVYRVLRNGKATKSILPSIAKIGAQMVEEYNRIHSPAYEMVAGEGAPQYTFAPANEEQLALF